MNILLKKNGTTTNHDLFRVRTTKKLALCTSDVRVRVGDG